MSKNVINKEKILDLLKYVIDPELMISIIDLGLVYDVRIDESAKKIEIDMTLSTPGCPVGDVIIDDVEQIVKREYNDFEVIVNLVWDPPWSLDKLTPEGRRALGMS